MKECNCRALQEKLFKLAQQASIDKKVYSVNVVKSCFGRAFFSMAVSPEGVVVNQFGYARFIDQQKCLACKLRPPSP